MSGTPGQGSGCVITMSGFFEMAIWSPYVVGVLIGILVCLAFLLSDRPIGCSTAFVKTRGLIEKALIGDRIQAIEYYREITPRIDWQFMIVPGIIIGAFLSSVLSGTFRFEFVPPLWTNTFGDTPVLRLIVALAGGIFLAVGSRWAGGCTSGHGISGTIQLSISSIVSATFFFVGGIATAMVLIHLIG
jgi:uncharacterized membrane protein YedE/YeeE